MLTKEELTEMRYAAALAEECKFKVVQINPAHVVELIDRLNAAENPPFQTEQEYVRMRIRIALEDLSEGNPESAEKYLKQAMKAMAMKGGE
jgi:Tfp pilus assembly protein PilF